MDSPAEAGLATATRANEPLAIVGIGCRFPGGVKDPSSFWDLILNARDGIVDVPADRWDADLFYDPDPSKPGKMFVRKGGFIDQPMDGFDALFFGISPREAERMDPQQRLLLETSWEALEDAGIPASSLAGSNTGVYIGAFTFDNQVTQLGIESRHLISSQTPTSSTFTMLSNRLSYFYDFRGPSVSMDTACSSSLVALHHACQAIWQGECDLVLSGGANILYRPETYISMCKGQFLAPDGRSKSFDSRADGYGRGEGAGVIVIKPMSAALADGDRIYSLIKATGANQDGRTNGITVPNPVSQQALCRSVCEKWEIDPSSIQLIEAHGTGTPVGDPIEANSLGTIYGKARPEGETVALGSVKANIGHTEAAAGVAGVIKACLSLHHATIPPLANLEEPNPGIPFEELGLRLPRAPEPMVAKHGAPKVAINSFGYGGTNAHVILEQFQRDDVSAPEQVSADTDGQELLFPISARSNEALRDAVEVYLGVLPDLAADYALADLCYSAALRRSHLSHRLVVRCTSIDDLRTKLETYLSAGQADGVATGKVDIGVVEKPVFVFTGMGPQWWCMGRELMQEEPVFRAAVEECDAIFQRIAGWSIIEELARDEEESRIKETQIAQPANFVVQFGLAKMLEARGVKPAAILGHSVGEVTSACVSGVLSLEDALLVSYHRSRIQKKTAGQGRMLAVGLPEAEALQLLQGHEDVASIAAVNSPNSVTLAGQEDVLETIAATLEEQSIFNRMLDVEVPYHSHYMDPLKPEMRECLAALQPGLPTTPLYSTVTGEAVASVMYDAEYWCDNIREPVYFAKTLSSVMADGHALFLEVGPHPVLSTSIKECIAASGNPGASASTLRRKKPEMATFADGISALYCAGLDLDWMALLPPSTRLAPLPLYRFQRESYWFESPVANASRLGVGADGHPLLERRIASHNPTWESSLNVGILPYIPDHIVDGVVLFPGAGYIEAVLAMHHRLTEADASVLTDIAFQRALIVDGDEEPVISVSLDEVSQRFQVHSRVGGADDKWTAHATGVVSTVSPGPSETVDLDAVRERCAEFVDVDDIYDALESRGLVYGDHFRRMTALSRGEKEALARIELHPEPGRHVDNYRLHPTLLDGCFQSLISLLSADHGGGSTFVPVAIDRLVLRKSPKPGFWSVGELVESTPDSITGHLTLVDDDGEVLAQVRGFRCQALARGQQSLSGLLGKIGYEVDWEELDAVDMVERSGKFLVFADDGDAANALTANLAGRGAVKPIRVSKAELLADPVALMTLLDDAPDYAGIVWLHGSASDQADEVEGLSEVDGFSTLIRAIDASGLSPRVYGVTENSAAVVEGDRVDGIDQAPLAGLLRVVLNEYPDLHCTAIDTDGTPEAPNALAAEILADTREDNVALRSGQRYGQRVLRARVKERDEALSDDQPEVISADDAFELDQLAIGSIDSLVLRQTERRAPEAGEIEVKLVATSLNFKDVAKAMNLMSEAALEGTFHGRGLGLEASGRVVRVGEGVTEYNVGDPVIFSVQGCFRRYATLEVDPRRLNKVADTYDLVEASGIPTVFLTAYYALQDVARLQPGEKVLIHAGAGGVGLAAIQVAKWIGAEIFATAGSEEKRDYLRSLGVQHVMDSRSLDFAEQIQEITGGRGVDVVLNSLPKEYIHKSLEVLASFGRFVEIGKKDLVEGTNISLLPFNKVLSFDTVDFDIMVEQRPELAIRVLRDMLPRFEAGEFKPIRTKAFPASELRDAFKYMARSQHIGKVVIQWDAEDTVEALPRPDRNRVFKSDAAYLVTGGLGGFGLAMAEWLVGRGVRHLALVGRRGAASEEAKARIAAMEAASAVIDVMKVDITDRVQVKAMINELAGRDVPLKGVFHAAAVLDDAPISELDRERFEAVMRPKILGGRYLDEATEGIDLDVFVLFSSVASVIGNARQANYVVANGWFDAFASNRRARGLPATSINWGPIADVGMAAGNEVLVKTLAASGFTPTTVQEGMEALEHTVRWDLAQIGLFDLDWSTWSSIEPTSGASPRFAGLVASDSDDLADNPLYNELLAMPNDDRTDVVGYLLIEQIAETLRIPPDKLEVTDSIGDLGMDSLMAVELQIMIKQRMGVELSALEMMKGESIGQMGGMILKKMNLDAGDPDAVPDVPDIDASAIDQMSDEDVEKLLQSAAE